MVDRLRGLRSSSFFFLLLIGLLCWGREGIGLAGDEVLLKIVGSSISHKDLETILMSSRSALVMADPSVNHYVALNRSKEEVGDRVVASDTEQRADFRGRIKTVTPSDAGNQAKGWWGTLLVEVTGEDISFDQASVDISSETQIFQQAAGGLKPGMPDDLKTGLSVDVYCSGRVSSSYPVQARAWKVVIIGSCRESK